MEDEFEGFFMESTEDMGILFNSYQPLLEVTDHLLNKVIGIIKALRKNAEDSRIDLSADIKQFKQSISIQMKPAPIVIGETRKWINIVKGFRDKLNRVLSKYVKAKNDMSFKSNLKRVAKRPSVYVRNPDEEKYATVNNNIRNVGRALDWIEKALIDLFNLADQDLNILNIVDKVYNKPHIYESVRYIPDGIIMEEAPPDITQPALDTPRTSRPRSDNPIRDTMQDIDARTGAINQKAKKGVQAVQQTVRAAVRPVKRTAGWVKNLVQQAKDMNEMKAKEKMADPHARSALLNAAKKCIIAGSLLEAGILLNPFFLAIMALGKVYNHKNKFRLRNEMIGELKTEIQIVDEKIKDLDNDYSGDRAKNNEQKYKLMRFKNELTKKLLRVGGDKGFGDSI